MEMNPALKQLGYEPDARVVIFHADDIGMCQASLDAYVDLLEAETVSSAAVMVPCPWFPAVAALSSRYATLDLGVHLTLNSEWDAYRWRPISTCDPSSGLIDVQGYLHKSLEALHHEVQPDAVAAEARAQVTMALRAGVAPTHLDSHMGAIAHPALLGPYIDVALEYQLPTIILRMDAQGYQGLGMGLETAQAGAALAQRLEARGVPLVDRIVMLPLDEPAGRLERTLHAIEALPPGLTHFILHPARDTPELRAIASDWQARVADYQTFISGEFKRFLRSAGIQRLGYAPLQEMLASHLS